MLGPKVLVLLREGLADPPGHEAKITDAAYGNLIRREQEILRPLIEGQASKKIAGRLCISRKTVKTHRANLKAELNLHSTLEMVRYAARLGLIDVDRAKS